MRNVGGGVGVPPAKVRDAVWHVRVGGPSMVGHSVRGCALQVELLGIESIALTCTSGTFNSPFLHMHSRVPSHGMEPKSNLATSILPEKEAASRAACHGPN